MPYLLLFAGMLCFGWSNCLWRPQQEKRNAQHLIFLRSLWTVPLIALAGIALGNTLNGQCLKLATYSIPYIVLSLAGLWCFVSSMRYQTAGISGSMILYIGFFGSLVAWWLAGDRLPTYFGYTAVLYILGLLLISPGIFNNTTPWRGTALALLAALCWAFANIGLKQGIEESGIWNLSLIQECTVLCVSGLISMGTGKSKGTSQPATTKRNNWIKILPLSILTIGGVIFSNASLADIPVLHFALITMVQPVTTLFVSSMVYREKLSLRQWTGGLLLMCGSVLCALK